MTQVWNDAESLALSRLRRKWAAEGPQPPADPPSVTVGCQCWGCIHTARLIGRLTA